MHEVHLENTCIEKVEGMSLHTFAFACFLRSKFLSSHYVIRSVSNSDMGEKGSPRQANTGRGHSKTFFCNRFLTGRHLSNSGEAQKTLCRLDGWLYLVVGRALREPGRRQGADPSSLPTWGQKKPSIIFA